VRTVCRGVAPLDAAACEQHMVDVGAVDAAAAGSRTTFAFDQDALLSGTFASPAAAAASCRATTAAGALQIGSN
jgi:hypothetical protein